MNILLISQCDKRALTETRRILDQFAERRGDRTWQTPITEAGLDTLRKLLRKTARKNTSVACHWIRGRDHSELLWIVGDARRFNPEGAVPTNTTARNVLRRQDENDWHTAQDIRLLAQLAALLHDLGKATVAFQQRLVGKRSERNLYRHEWVSLRLFQAFVGSDDDEGWLRRMTDAEGFDESQWIAEGRYQRDGIDASDRYPFQKLPPLAAAIGWLIVSHHRLPVAPPDATKEEKVWWGKRVDRFNHDWLRTPLDHVSHDWNELETPSTRAEIEPYWTPAAHLPVTDATWRKHAARIARQLQERNRTRKDSAAWLGNGYVMHLARLCLMLAEHDYSRLGVDRDGKPVEARRAFVRDHQTLYANTRKPCGATASVPNQSLLEHLLGVGHGAGQVAHALPGFERHLPRLVNHRGLRKRSADARFSWQDRAFDAAVGMRETAAEHGAFIINMASTGCGKTLANARILYALADPQQGLRASYALGLRALTLQTGRSYRHDLHLGDDELAVQVGGSANRALFEFYEQKAETGGSASVQSLIEEDSHVFYEGNTADHPLLSRALADADIRKLLSAPMLVCTVDHVAPATEALRAGRQIAPMLRLMSSDLVLDELDDYDLDDLPALTRLVHWAGMLGTRVVLSSATLPPALVEGMYQAYRAGRRLYRRNRGQDGGRADAPVEVPCLWADEFGVQVQACGDEAAFAEGHRRFVEKRVTKLEQATPLRRVELQPLRIGTQQRERIRSEFARHIHEACLHLHASHAEVDPVGGSRASFGIVRMANIDAIFDVARGLHALGAPQGTRIHLCVYHARFPLVQRSAIEHMLDVVLNRRDPQAVWRHPSVRSALDAHPDDEHLFVVLASPVCEVGRDWDADWAVVEPSSMRSLIQLAGRVQRHRRTPPQSPNIMVFDTNLKALEEPGGQKAVFVRPGFEKESLDGRFLLASHRLDALWPEGERKRIDATPRIRPRPTGERQPRNNWIDLEHARMEAAMLPQALPEAGQNPGSRRRSSAASWQWQRDLAAPTWQFPKVMLTGVLPQQQPFREDNRPDRTLVFLPDDDEETLVEHRVEDDPARRGSTLYVAARELLHRIEPGSAPGIAPWGDFDLMVLLVEQAESLDKPLADVARTFSALEVPRSDQGWRWHPWLGFTRQR
ncbi:MAG: type I-F CRISPR-associated helicase Cas3f [Thermomonas sp.]|uniref:type I-F CRISPR-associated helicase Cas3f n=1 Tax=Thermomonas sp. TaxID=1971895 RepID=UPI0039E4BC4A